MSIAIDYKPLLDDENGFAEGVEEGRGQFATVPYLVKWADRFPFVNRMLGVSEFVGGTWVMTPPTYYADSPLMFASSAQIRGTGEPTISANNTIPVYSHAIVTITYRTPNWNYALGSGGGSATGGNDPSFNNSVGYTQDEEAALAFADQQIDFGSEWYTIPGRQCKWKNGGSPIPITGQNVRFRVPTMSLTLRFHRIPWLPFRLISNYVGTINSNTFLGCAPGTVQFLGAGSQRQVDMTGNVVTQLEMKFKWRPKSWNMDVKPTGVWDYVVSDIGNPRYTSTNFLTLLTFRDYSADIPGWL